MGAKLSAFYDKAKEMGGLKAQMRMAILTRISSTKAKEADDSPENIKKFEEALNELEKEFK
jgi:hypothetical protein